MLHNVSAVGATDGEHPVNQTGSCETVPEGSSRTSMCETTVGTAVVEPPIEETPPVVVPTNQPGPSYPPYVSSPLPNTGGPNGLLLPGGAVLVVIGAGLVLADRRRRLAA